MVQKQAYRSMDLNWKPRNKPTQYGQLILDKGEKTDSSASGVGKAGQLHVSQWSENTLSLRAQKQIQHGLKTETYRGHHNTPRWEHRQNTTWRESHQCFLMSFSQGNRNKNINQQVGPNQAYKVLHSKPQKIQKDNLWNGREYLQMMPQTRA